jgi:branched-chain amino acid transport system substrate-binding protein
MKFAIKFVAASVALVCASAAFAQKGETVKLVRIDPLTGLLGPVGISQQKGYQFFCRKAQWCGQSSWR